jgi:hypothetical protein
LAVSFEVAQVANVTVGIFWSAMVLAEGVDWESISDVTSTAFS